MTTHSLTNVKVHSSLWQKTKGLIGEAEPESFGSGIALPAVNSIHTFFVGFPIDIVFLDKDNQVVKLAENLTQFRFSPIIFAAKTTLELKAGSIKKLKIKVGDGVNF
ncbi:MAG: hypothetical protein A3F35_01670 [Candidatus Woykebacteria bacterium RIFCSPHIGHO2_12_FULL_45_10]|uniref:DUF192 domain-containing protein n=1 Tax=Candidatus Woykebacteria bacterium RIFCSPHIGHO2_12_FULL_45_10 TaxID=1802603 RepID=A0A1G1WRW5_9BACT|nr:MAG: hypothetical protein A3F35_01670 [Candidatus Woykebacteria bacterium RIFCSPHIGHO2_12_FULL_45_10]